MRLDPWGADTTSSSNATFQPRKFTTYDRDGNGSDEAMMRRYNRYYSRFDQPDPYDGSYNLTDPQSFNRYAYVQNDPVNFVDPSGMEDDVIRINIRDSFLPSSPGNFNNQSGSGDGGGGPGLGTVTDRPDNESGDGGGGDPQNTDSKDKGTDCTRFADEVGNIASKHLYDLVGLANALTARFAREGERVSSDDFGSTGFKSNFKDDTPSQPGLRDNTPNQVRHYVGGFRSFVQGGIIGTAYANYRESPGITPSQKADLALNRVSTQHAQILAMNPAKIPDLKDMILRDVCE